MYDLYYVGVHVNSYIVLYYIDKGICCSVNFLFICMHMYIVQINQHTFTYIFTLSTTHLCVHSLCFERESVLSIVFFILFTHLVFMYVHIFHVHYLVICILCCFSSFHSCF